MWTLSAWCEQRTGFPPSGTDRIVACKATGDLFRDERGRTLKDPLARVAEEMARDREGER